MTTAETTVEPLHMGAEFTAWEDRLPSRPGRGTVFKSMTMPGGLPEGWQVRAHTEAVRADSTFRNTIGLVSRAGGGWAIVLHVTHPDSTSNGLSRATYLDTVEDSLEALYAFIRRTANETDGRRSEWAVPVEQMARTFIATHYNHDDPTEAAEATLVGLGAPLTVFPAALD